MAAMASPLLEAGAIDGARGILINITGSSSLKLSEVNEASTIIQNAAHEDANIIFGAVQDESMGDEVKITVIATGFRQQESMPAESQARRDRMLSGTGYGTALPAIHYDVPISRVAAARAQFVAEAPELPLRAEPAEVTQELVAEAEPEPVQEEEISQELVGSGHAEEIQEPRPHVAHPELIPVPRSVFDDDFFRVSARELLAQSTESRMPSARGFDSPDTPRPVRLQYEEASRALDSVLDAEPAVAEPAVRVPVFSGAVAREPAEADELDIPAFLRRSH
jgi:cell division protein FtsZ